MSRDLPTYAALRINNCWEVVYNVRSNHRQVLKCSTVVEAAIYEKKQTAASSSESSISSCFETRCLGRLISEALLNKRFV